MKKDIFFNTNIILDIALNRKPFAYDTFKLLVLIEEKLITGYVSSITVINVYYIISKIKGRTLALEFIKDLLQTFEVVDTDKSILIQAVYSGFEDYEDAAQNYSAVNYNIEIIITRNRKDFSLSKLKIYTASEFIIAFFPKKMFPKQE